MERTSTRTRTTGETDIQVELDLDRFNEPRVQTPVPFFDHMLNQLGKHGNFALRVEGEGDVHVDSHHLVEDVGILLGQALDEALGDRRGIRRYASLALPLDETLVRVSLDVSGRSYLDFNLPTEGDVEGFPLEVLPEFFRGLTSHAGLTLHVDPLKSRNRHHLAEATFKGFARVLRRAVAVVGDSVPSTKGTID